ncbi:MAG: hypothetical protein MMC33_010514 [Icmadophila ericetorum]|nr:hypothetical protein [Icmadophila ericetorum]
MPGLLGSCALRQQHGCRHVASRAGQVQLEGRVHPDAAVALDACPVVGAQPGRAPAHHMGSAEQLPDHVRPLVWTTAMPLKAGTAHHPGEEALQRVSGPSPQSLISHCVQAGAAADAFMGTATAGESMAEKGSKAKQAHPGQYSFPCTSPWSSSACIHCSGSTKSDVPASPGSSRVSAHGQQAGT